MAELGYIPKEAAETIWAKGRDATFDVARIAPSTFVGEVVMKSEFTPLLRAVREKGCAVQVGTDMLFEMIPAYLEFFGFGTSTGTRRHAARPPAGQRSGSQHRTQAACGNRCQGRPRRHGGAGARHCG